jgi:predicted O-linked N-acetylglucosamine transferase (SPINDLY family)
VTECNRHSLLQRFTELGVDPARITLESRAPHYDYLASYSRVDVALDPGRVSSARRGLDAFVARDDADYVARGIELGQGFDDERLSMRDRLAGSSMMDAKAFARQLESIYRRATSTSS